MAIKSQDKELLDKFGPCAYLHYHKFHKSQPGWMVMRQYKVQALLEKLKPIIEEGSGDCKKIFRQHPYSIWDNYFINNKITNWMGVEVFGGVMTCRRDQLPDNIPGGWLSKMGRQ
eukprot:15345068-Ditylum_brightwellii.AAC.1